MTNGTAIDLRSARRKRVFCVILIIIAGVIVINFPPSALKVLSGMFCFLSIVFYLIPLNNEIRRLDQWVWDERMSRVTELEKAGKDPIEIREMIAEEFGELD